jgi:Lon protease-like protein
VSSVLSAALPVIPHPDVVLFPHATLPLHVCEPCERALVRDVLAGDERTLVIALPRRARRHAPEFSAPVHPVACLARVETAEWRVDDCYDVVLAGIARVRLERTVREHPYRLAMARTLAEEPFGPDDPVVAVERRALIHAVERLAQAEALAPALAAALDPQIGFAALVNRVAMHLEIPPEARLALLALDSVVRRGHHVRELLERQLRHPPPRGRGEQN